MQRDAIARKVVRMVPLCATALALSASAAFADESTAASQDGFVHFSNVRVVNAPSAGTTTAQPTDAGMRIYRDSATGQMRGPSPEEMQAAAAAPATARPSHMTQFASRHSGVGIALDESFLQYSVVARNADGSLSEVCVDGADKADAINKTPALIQAAPKETINVR
jgi:hypothetical protein